MQLEVLVSRFMPHLNVLLQTKQHQVGWYKSANTGAAAGTKAQILTRSPLFQGKSKEREEREEDKQPDPEGSEREREAAQLQQLELVPGTDEQELEAYVECFGAVVQRMGQEAAKNPNPQSAACRLREKLTQGGLVRRYLILLYMCPHTAREAHARRARPQVPHTAIYVSSYCYICVLILLCICVLILL
jgi:hypothetical protein